jgi:hypothetical protein
MNGVRDRAGPTTNDYSLPSEVTGMLICHGGERISGPLQSLLELCRAGDRRVLGSALLLDKPISLPFELRRGARIMNLYWPEQLLLVDYLGDDGGSAAGR